MAKIIEIKPRSIRVIADSAIRFEPRTGELETPVKHPYNGMLVISVGETGQLVLSQTEFDDLARKFARIAKHRQIINA